MSANTAFLLVALLASGPMTVAAQTAADDTSGAAAASRAQTGEEPIYGSQLMTSEERVEYRNRMRSATTMEERERLRAEHHSDMVARAKERGVTLPEEPPARMGAGPGSQMGPGPGMGRGPGAGMGPSSGPGPDAAGAGRAGSGR